MEPYHLWAYPTKPIKCCSYLSPRSSLSSPFLETDLKENINELLLRKESLWKQKFSVTWLTSIDVNTKFYHASTSIRLRRNNIGCLKLDQNLWTVDHPTIIQKIQSHFQNIFSSCNPLPLVLNNFF